MSKFKKTTATFVAKFKPQDIKFGLIYSYTEQIVIIDPILLNPKLCHLWPETGCIPIIHIHTSTRWYSSPCMIGSWHITWTKMEGKKLLILYFTLQLSSSLCLNLNNWFNSWLNLCLRYCASLWTKDGSRNIYLEINPRHDISGVYICIRSTNIQSIDLKIYLLYER